MKKLYKVKVTKETPKGTEKINGYLAAWGEIQQYERGEAIKKAHMFNGITEPVKPTIIYAEFKMAQIPENCLLHGIVKQLEGRETFVDVDNELNEKMYNGDVFDAILMDVGAFSPLNEKEIEQLKELSLHMNNFTYVMVSKSL